jgi:Amt family ammonium transporter
LKVTVAWIFADVGLFMQPRFRSGHEVSTLATFDRFRINLFAGVQQQQLRRYGMGLMAAGAGLLPLMAGSANAALTKLPTDGADTLLMLFGSALVLLMTPGLAFFYGGFTRSKNVLNTMMMSFFLMGLIGVLWVVVGYSLAFGTGFKSPFIGGLESMRHWPTDLLFPLALLPFSRACLPSSPRLLSPELW